MDSLTYLKDEVIQMFFGGHSVTEVMSFILNHQDPKDIKYFLGLFYRSKEKYSGDGSDNCWAGVLLSFIDRLNPIGYERNLAVFFREIFSDLDLKMEERHNCLFCSSKLATILSNRLSWLDDPADFGLTPSRVDRLAFCNETVQRRLRVGKFRSEEEYFSWLKPI